MRLLSLKESMIPLDRSALENWRIFVDRELDCPDARRVVDLPPSAVRLGRYVASLRIQSLDLPEEEQLPDGYCSLGDDPDLYAEHLQIEAKLLDDVIDEAIREWSRTQLRPNLSEKPDCFLSCRLGLASWILQYLLMGEDLPDPEDLAEPPDLNDWPKFLRWLLIDVWDARGHLFLEQVARDIKSDIAPS